MPYLVRHLTRFTYTSPVSESVMELRMQPLSDGRQRLLRFDVTTTPRTRVFAYRDFLGNAVHYFDIPGRHTRLDISAEATVDVVPPDGLPEALDAKAWDGIDELVASGAYGDWLAPSRFAIETPALKSFAASIGVKRDDGGDPLTLLRRLNATLYEELSYEPRTTRVDSPIDEALAAKAGVCQDFAHIMTALVRGLGIPCRYVSGYLAPRASGHDRSTEHATHAWVEALLPEVGWLGFDPTNDTLALERHIAVALGRDYGDVPPTKGVFKGESGSELGVAVSVTRAESTMQAQAQDLVPSVIWIAPGHSEDQAAAAYDQHQQQQQQQQQQ
jgi:transglutaminase-like putative cysteine protease